MVALGAENQSKGPTDLTIPTIPEPEPEHTASPKPNEVVEQLKDIAFGSIAGLAGKVIEYPFDTVKVRLQSQRDHLPLQYKGPLDCFRQSIQRDGFRSLYRGVSAPLFGAALETASLFWSYRLAQIFLHQNVYTGSSALPLSGLMVAGALSGGVTSLILTPIELVKCRMQVPLHSSLDPTLSARTILSSTTLSPFAVIADVYRREGISGFWRGQLGTFLRETGGTAAWFGAYEATTMYFKQQRAQQASESNKSAITLPVHLQMASGALAGMSYNFIFYPADTIKSKIQTGELANVRPTFTGVGRELWRTHGLKGLYRGCGITVARSAPSSALIFTIVEKLREFFG